MEKNDLYEIFGDREMYYDEGYKPLVDVVWIILEKVRTEEAEKYKKIMNNGRAMYMWGKKDMLEECKKARDIYKIKVVNE